MPNHVKSILTFSGDEEKVKEMLDEIKYEDFGVGTFSFEKVIPMPDNIFRGNLGPRERAMYGKNNWYDWSIENWGTKWNAYGFGDYDDVPENTVMFNSAWSAPHKVIDKLAEMYPHIQIVHEWADEDMGNNCGRIEYLKGERRNEYYPQTYSEGLALAADVWGYDLSDYGFVKNRSGNGYVSKYDREFEKIKVLGQTALYSESVLTNDDIPAQLYLYQLSRNEKGDLCYLGTEINDTAAGSVVTKELVFMGKNGKTELEPENIVFLSEKETFEDFMDYEQNEEVSMMQ